MHFALKPIKDPAAPYGETLFPIFCDSLDEAIERSAYLLRHNVLFDKHKLVQVFTSGTRRLVGHMTLNKLSDDTKWKPAK